MQSQVNVTNHLMGKKVACGCHDCRHYSPLVAVAPVMKRAMHQQPLGLLMLTVLGDQAIGPWFAMQTYPFAPLGQTLQTSLKRHFLSMCMTVNSAFC